MPHMRSAMSVRTDNTEMDMDDTESDIGKLQRQFRILERDHQAYSIQAQEQSRKQQLEIGKLMKEQEKLHQNLRSYKNLSPQNQNTDSTQRLQALLQQKDDLEQELQKEKQIQEQLQKTISSMKLKVVDHKKGMLKNRDLQNTEGQKTQRAIRTLEYKLDTATTRFNELLTKKTQLKDELQTLYGEKARFQQLRNRLSKELQEVQNNVMEMINASTAAYDARTEAQSKMLMIKEKAMKDLAQYDSEMKELKRLIGDKIDLKGFLSTKCFEKGGQDDYHETGSRQGSRKHHKVDTGEDTLAEEFEKIQALTGEDDLDLLVSRFIQAEDQNFNLFNFVIEQNNETETLRAQVNQIQEEMEQFQLKVLKRDQSHQCLLTDTEGQLNECKSQAESYEDQVIVRSKLLEEIKTGVNNIFAKMDCDRSLLEDKLGVCLGVTENNIMAYLGFTEMKAHEQLAMQAFLLSKDQEKGYNPAELSKILLGQNPEQFRHILEETLNSMQQAPEDFSLTDEVEQPISQHELRTQILDRVVRAESSASHGMTETSRSSHHRRQRTPEDALI